MKSIQKLLWLFALVALALNTACNKTDAPDGESKGSGSAPATESQSKGSGTAPAVKPDAEAKPEAKQEAEAKAEAETPAAPESAAASVNEPAAAVATEVKTAAPAAGDDSDNGTSEWPQWGRDATNNMVASAKGIMTDFTAGEVDDEGEVTGAKHAKWVVKLGSQTYGTPTIANGQVYVGTNNEEPRNEKIIGDRGVVMVFDEATGDFKWQLTSHKLGAGKVSDWEYLGMCSSATIDGKYGYVVTNRGEVLCFDTYGLSDGNDGPYKDEAKYLAAEGEEPMEPGDTDADIVWIYNMRDELGVFPHNITSSSVVIGDGKVFASTSNGVDWTHLNKPAPQAPCFIALDKETGELVGEEGAGIGNRIMHCNWSSPAYSEINGTKEAIFGAGDGFVYGFGTTPEKDAEGFDILPTLWSVDVCPKEYRFDESGEPIKYATYPGPSEIISSPVTYNDKIYVAIGQDPEHGEGVGALTCIDPSKGEGQDAIVWQFKEIGRTISTPSIVDGLVYISDYAGKLYCLDAETGQKYWEHDTLSHIWGSTTVVDGKVFLGNEDGELAILKAGKEYEEINTVEFPASIYSSVVVANNTFYVTTGTHLYAYKIGE